VPEDQLTEKIAEYGEYIKVFILIAVVIAIVYFVLKWYFKRKKHA
ncbi:MAG: DedA family protein, partial [Prevotella salivae]|nr:DedA family protein [Segatella salivae]